MSPWAYLQRFCYANCLTEKQMYEALGRDGERAPYKSEVNRRDLIGLAGFVDDKVRSVFGVSFAENNERFAHTVLGMVWNDTATKLRQFLRPELSYCPECVQLGFHSYLHQLRGLSVCPFHGVPLQHACPSCRQTFSYAVGYKEFRQPFTCRCGYFFLRGKETGLWDVQNWAAHQEFSIQHPALLRLLSWNPSEGYIMTYPVDGTFDYPLEYLADMTTLALSDRTPTTGRLSRFGSPVSDSWNGCESCTDAQTDDCIVKVLEGDSTLSGIAKSVAKCLLRYVRRSMVRSGHRRMCLVEGFRIEPSHSRWVYCVLGEAYEHFKVKDEFRRIPQYWIVENGVENLMAFVKHVEPIGISSKAGGRELFRFCVSLCKSGVDIQSSMFRWIFAHLYGYEAAKRWTGWVKAEVAERQRATHYTRHYRKWVQSGPYPVRAFVRVFPQDPSSCVIWFPEYPCVSSTLNTENPHYPWMSQNS
ncbi:MAG: TniQ family protein [Firmicutes bacterium]|nr:TniQ family protein [Bacillota bacterium]